MDPTAIIRADFLPVSDSISISAVRQAQQKKGGFGTFILVLGGPLNATKRGIFFPFYFDNGSGFCFCFKIIIRDFVFLVSTVPRTPNFQRGEKIYKAYSNSHTHMPFHTPLLAHIISHSFTLHSFVCHQASFHMPLKRALQDYGLIHSC